MVSCKRTMTKEKTFSRIRDRFKAPGKNLFWAWVVYQSIKGILTLSFIWIPLLYIWFSKG